MGRNGSVASPRASTLPPRAQVPILERPAMGLLVTLAGVSFVAHMLVAGNYGYCVTSCTTSPMAGTSRPATSISRS